LTKTTRLRQFKSTLQYTTGVTWFGFWFTVTSGYSVCISPVACETIKSLMRTGFARVICCYNKNRC